MRGYRGKIGLGMYLTFNLLTHLLAGSVEVENPEEGVSILITFPRQIS
jgi:signal transduction histidine kinase